MLYYLLWKCMQNESPYNAILFGVGSAYFIARKTAGTWAYTSRQEQQRVSQNDGEKAIGLVDVNPEGEFKIDGRVVMAFNVQEPCTRHGLNRLVVVASGGSSLTEFDKGNIEERTKELFLPVWKESDTRTWARKLDLVAGRVTGKRKRNVEGVSLDKLKVCGMAVPRLIIWHLRDDKFREKLEVFIKKILGKQSAAETHENAKDAHTMVLLCGSEELSAGTAADANKKAGEKIGFVSEYVQDKVIEAMGIEDKKGIED
eukprot:6346978-Amphidinium_carterae.1